MVALFLVLLLSIENFAAVVSDNDGAAFITKAEFDSLKNSFQSQIDQYNTSIDSKIDGAIAGYLAGINIAKEEMLYTPYFEYKIDDGYDGIEWWSGTTPPGDIMKDLYTVPFAVTKDIWFTYVGGSSQRGTWTGKSLWWKANASATSISYNANPTNFPYYNNMVVLDTSGKLLYNAQCATIQHMRYICTLQGMCADHSGASTQIDQWNGGDWGNGQRWTIHRCETKINSKIRTPICPNVTTQYVAIKYGSNVWNSWLSHACTPRSWIQWTRSSGEYTSAQPPSDMYSYQGMCLPEGMASESQKWTYNTLSIASLVSANSNNGQMKYGIYIGNFNKDSKGKIKITCSHAGTIKLRTAKNNGNSSQAVDFKTYSVVVGTNKFEFDNIEKNTNLYLLYLPTSTSAYGKISNLDIIQIVE